MASDVVQEAWREEHVCVWGWGRGSWGEGEMLDPAAFAGRCLLCLPFAALKQRKCHLCAGYGGLLNGTDNLFTNFSEESRIRIVSGLCVIPRLTPVLLKVCVCGVGDNVYRTAQSLRTFETDLLLFEIIANERDFC